MFLFQAGEGAAAQARPLADVANSQQACRCSCSLLSVFVSSVFSLYLDSFLRNCQGALLRRRSKLQQDYHAFRKKNNETTLR